MDYQESMMKKWIIENTLHTGIFCFLAIIVSFVIYNLDLKSLSMKKEKYAERSGYCKNCNNHTL